MKYFVKILLGLALLSGVFLQAEEPYDMEWVSQFGTTSGDNASSVTRDNHGNLYATGTTRGTFEGENSTGIAEGFIAKFDNEGRQLWVKQFGTSYIEYFESITIDESGNLFVTGYTRDTKFGDTDALIAKFDNEGRQLWFKRFGTDATDLGEFIAIDSEGNLFVTSVTGGTFDGETRSGHWDAYLAKFDTEGRQLWVRQFGTSNTDGGGCITTDSDGNIFVSGATGGIFGGETSSGDWDAFIAKFDTEGRQLWVKQFGTSAVESASAITTDSNENLFVAGYTRGIFDGESSSGAQDAYIAKFDNEGRQLWVKQFGTSYLDHGKSIIIEESGNLFVGGITDGTFDGESSSGVQDAFIAKFDNEGRQLWVRQFGTESTDHVGDSIASDENGNLFVAGYTLGTFDGESSSSSSTDAYIAKFSANTIPIANAGEDQSSVVGDIVQLDGSGSFDADGDQLTYNWTLVKPDGSGAEILNPTSAFASFIPDMPGTYTASLIVNDGFADSEPDTAKIVVVSVSTAITEIINEAIVVIDAMPDDSFGNPNLRKALINKLNATLKMVDDGEYQEALDKLQSDILPKIDGCSLRGEPDRDDWIIECEDQEEVYDLIIKAIYRLETLI